MGTATTLIVTAAPNPNEPAAMQAYLKGVLPLLVGAGGTLVRRLKVTKMIDGARSYGLVLMMDFASTDAVTEVFASADYAALLPHRDAGFSEITISLGASM